METQNGSADSDILHLSHHLYYTLALRPGVPVVRINEIAYAGRLVNAEEIFDLFFSFPIPSVA